MQLLAFFVTLYFLIINPKHKKLMSKKAPDLVLFRLFFTVTTLLDRGETGMTITELSNAWKAYKHTDELPITRKIFDLDRQRIGNLFGITIEKHPKPNEEHLFYIANPHVLEKNENLKFALNASRMIRLQKFFSLDGSRLDIHHFVDDIEKVLFFGEALMKNSTVKFQYQKFDCSPIRTVTMNPYWMKDYEDRMYIVGHIPSWRDRKKVVCFALDRIIQYENVPTKRHFRVPVGLDPISYYMNVVGLVVPEDRDIQKITIRAYGDEPNYLLTKKIHHSQQLVGEWDKSMPYADFDLFLIPNKEFKAKLISRIHRLEVLSPQTLREDILTTLDLSASRYRGA